MEIFNELFNYNIRDVLVLIVLLIMVGEWLVVRVIKIKEFLFKGKAEYHAEQVEAESLENKVETLEHNNVERYAEIQQLTATMESINSSLEKIEESIRGIQGDQMSIVNDVGSISRVVSDLADNDKAQMEALQESMHDRMSQKIRYYRDVLHGIPENEIQANARFMKAYKGIHGNHGLEEDWKKANDELPTLRVITVKPGETI